MNSSQIELAVARHFGYRQCCIVPNVSWGIGLRYEADLVVLKPSGWAVEVEIKVSASDIVADTKKLHQHDSKLFRELYFAVPKKLSAHPSIPLNAGVLSVCLNHGNLLCVEVLRRSALNKSAIKWSEAKRLKLLELGMLRVWNLKERFMEQRLKREALGMVDAKGRLRP